MAQHQDQTEQSSTPPSIRVEISDTTPILTYILIGIIVLVFLINLVTGNMLVALGSKDNVDIVNGKYWQLFTAMFLHQAIWHIALNGYFLYVVGPFIERYFGYWRYLTIYLLAGLAGSIASFALTQGNSIGASGALFGLIGAMIPFWYRNRHILRDTRQRLRNILWIIGINLAIGFFDYFRGLIDKLEHNGFIDIWKHSGFIDIWGHIGGLMGGLVLAWFMTPRYVIQGMKENRLQLRDKSSTVIALLTSILFAAMLAIITGTLITLRR